MRERTQSRTGCGRRHKRELDVGEDTEENWMQEKTQKRKGAGEGHSKVEELVCTHVLWM